ncbi:hypothetical protein K2X30_10530 [bacterium]|jgi:hypothetical protein|nr:hypothetical protein [bacterium]
MKRNMRNLVVILALALSPNLAFAQGATLREGTFNAETKQKMGMEKSPFKACKDVTLVGEQAFKKNESYWKEYAVKCKGQTTLQVVPHTAVTSPVMSDLVGKEKSDSAKENRAPNDSLFGTIAAESFLDKIGEGALKQLKEAENKVGYLERCIDRKSPCRGLIDKEVEKANKELANARLNLGFIQSASDTVEADQITALKSGDPTRLINSKLEADVKFITPPIALEGAEYDKVKAEYAAQLQKLKAEMEGEIKAEKNTAAWSTKRESLLPKYRKKLVEDFLTKKRAAYLNSLSKAPFLGYLPKKDPNEEELRRAWPKMKEDIQKTIAMVKDTRDNGKTVYEVEDGMGGTYTTSAGGVRNKLDFMWNTAVVESVLDAEKASNSPSSCATATGLANYLKVRRTQKKILAGSAIAFVAIAGGLGAPSLAGAAGVTSAAALNTSAVVGGFVSGFVPGAFDVAITAAQTRGLEGAARAGVTSFETADEVRTETDKEFNSFLWNPMSYGGAIGTFTGGTKALLNIARAKNAATATQVKTIVGKANAGSPVARVELNNLAAKAESDALGQGVTDAERSLVEAAATKGALGKPHAPDTEVLDEMKAANVSFKNKAERDAFYKDVMADYMKVKSDKSPKEVLQAIIAMKRFGIKDKQTMLANLETWPGDSLKGLKMAYQEGSLGLKQGKSSEQAFKDGLEKLMKNQSQYKGRNLSAAEQKGMKDKVQQMCACAGVCGVAGRASNDFDTGVQIASCAYIPSTGALTAQSH